ncbi:sigma-70 family RNA polymerase sigma factor [Frankia sp. R82]|uniref:RNA polymerase sigma factor n=1 Tax=Frankia sp. R82 TaxID=2950553 RepID=UPI0020430DE4|nr:sigma-70 family RNA polymerase sigma factor [Frankia sp. R82]MCM3885353.1 sigma-70 family RNA polymerase sigma factor [Frankia sp. R82]
MTCPTEEIPSVGSVVGTSVAELDRPYSEQRWSLILPHRERLIHIARRRLPSKADAEDCVHEAFIRAAGFRDLDASRVGQFLTTTVLRLCVDHHRARQRAERAVVRGYLQPWEPAPDDSVCDRAEARWLLARAGTLRGRERQVIMARAAGMSTREAAADLEISLKAAEGAFTRGRARLISFSRN